MKKTAEDKNTDIEICKAKIELILKEYNCSIQSDDYHSAWLIDNDTNVTVGFSKCCT